MIAAFSAVSTNENAFDAGREAAQAAMAGLSAAPSIFWVFGAIAYDQQRLLDGVAAAAGDTPLIGCTTDGEISTAGLSVDSVVVLAMASDSIQFHTASVEHLSKDSFGAGVALAKQFQSLDSRYLQVFSDGLTGNADKVLQGIKSRLGEDIKIAGGTAGDGGHFKQTFQYCRGRVLNDSIVAVAFDGDFSFGTGTACGWFPVGLTKQVTRAVDNVVYELDGRPALQAYEKFLGKHAALLPAVGVEYPLGLLGPYCDAGEETHFLCRATMGVDREAGAVVFAGDVPQGARVKMTIGNDADIIAAAGKGARIAMDKLPLRKAASKPKVVFLYSCMARKLVLGSRTNEEILAVQHEVGNTVPLIGFYTYGEYAPAGRSDHSFFHNETVTMTVIGD